jgi:tetratricopeptide (TPR) repeat protein
MKRRAFFLMFVLLAGFAFTGISPVRASAAPVENKWVSVRTKHFHLIGDANEKNMRKAALKMEQFRTAFQTLFSRAKFNDAIPMTVVVFRDEISYKPFLPEYKGKKRENIAGYFVSGRDINYITINADTLDRQLYPLATIFHEYTHLILDANLKNIPVWLHEGMAEYYETLKVDDDGKKVIIGSPQSYHALLLREKPLIPLKELFAVDHDSKAYNEGNRVGIFYAESWALIHFMLQYENGKYAKQLPVFMGRLTDGDDPETAFTETFQMSLKQMEEQLNQYVRRFTMPVVSYNFAKPLVTDADITLEPLAEADRWFHLGDLFLHTREYDQAREYLQRGLALDADSAALNGAMGLLHLRRNQYPDAVRFLKKSADSPKANAVVHFHLAEALLQANDSKTSDALPAEVVSEMRSELTKAATLSPDFPETYRLHAYLEQRAGSLDEALKLIRKGVSLAPGREQFQLDLARILVKRNKSETFDHKFARRILTPLAKNSPNPITRAMASELLQRVGPEPTAPPAK